MKQLVRFGGLGLALAFLAGCIQVDMVVHVRPDGSGTVEETVLIAKDSMQGIQEMMKGVMEGMASQMEAEGMDMTGTGAQTSAFGKDLDLFDEAKLRQNARSMGDGVTYVSGERIETDKAEGYKARYAFTDINTLRLSTSPSGKGPAGLGSGAGAQGSKQAFASFRFVKGPPAVLRIMVPEEMTSDNLQPPQVPGTTPAAPAGTAIPEQMKEIFKDMRIRMAVQVEGDIIRTNATHRQGPRVTLMDIDFGTLLSDMETLQEINQEMTRNPEKAKSLLEELPGIKVELNPEVRIEFAGVEPRSAAYWMNKGSIAYTYGNAQAAVECFSKAIAVDPNNGSAYFNLGISYGELGQYDQALSSIDRAIELNPGKGAYFYGRGNVYLLSGRRDKAVEDFKRAAALGDRDAKAFLEGAGPSN